MKKNVVIVIKGLPSNTEEKIINELVQGISALYITEGDEVQIKVTHEDDFIDRVFGSRKARFDEPSEEIKHALNYIQAQIGEPEHSDFRNKLANAMKQVISGRLQDEGKLVKALSIVIDAQNKSADAKYIKSRHFEKHLYHFVSLLRAYEIIRGGFNNV